MSLSASGVPSFDLVAGVDVLGVLPEDDHVDQLGVQHRRGHAGEPAHRAQADVEVEDLAQGHVERADAAADRRGERALDPDQVLAERLDRLVGQPVAGLVEGLLPGQHLLPGDLVAVLGGGGVEDELGGRPDVDAGAVALDEGDDGLVGDDQVAVVAHADEICHGSDATGRGAGSSNSPCSGESGRPGRQPGRTRRAYAGDSAPRRSRHPVQRRARRRPRCPSATISSMSSQSLGRSNTALQTMRSSGARIGMSTGPNRTRRARLGHFEVQIRSWRKRRQGRNRPSPSLTCPSTERWRPDPRALPSRPVVARHLEDRLRGLRRQGQVDVDVSGRPRDCGTRRAQWLRRTGGAPRAESSISWSETILGTKLPNCPVLVKAGSLWSVRSPGHGAWRARGPVAGTACGSGRESGLKRRDLGHEPEEVDQGVAGVLASSRPVAAADRATLGHRQARGLDKPGRFGAASGAAVATAARPHSPAPPRCRRAGKLADRPSPEPRQ